MTTIAFCEINPFCRRVLAKHWPGVVCYHDIKELSANHLAANQHGVIDLICGGFPCQDISVAGRGMGIEGERSGLWAEFARLIGEVGPRYVIVENVAVLRSRGLGRVLGDLAALGYDAEWHCIPASAVGAPHQRDRIWIIAYASGGFVRNQPQWWDGTYGAGEAQSGNDGQAESLAHTDSPRRERSRPAQSTRWQHEPVFIGGGADVANTVSTRLVLWDGRDLARWAQTSTAGTDWWATEPNICRMVNGSSTRVDRRERLIALGNSLVPQIPEMIGRAIMEREKYQTKFPNQ